MEKEKGVFILLIIIYLISIISLVNAQYYSSNFNIDYFIDQIKIGVASIFGPIFGHEYFDEFLFAKILLFLLIFTVVFTVLKKNIKIFERNWPAQTLIAVIFGIFAVRYLQPSELINAVLLPYGGFGAAITIFLPLVIYFYFVHTSVSSPFGRRAAWFIYGAVFIVLWLSRPYQSLGEANWIYLLGLGFIIISLLFDSRVHSYFEMGRHNRVYRNMLQERLAEISARIRDAEIAGMDDLVEDLQDRRRDIIRRLARYT